MKAFFTLVATALVEISAWAQATVPVTFAITDQTEFNTWTVIDANASTSANTWTYSNGEALYTEDRKNVADDWLISPAVTLEAGVTYTVNYYIVQRSSYSSDKQKYAITVGNSATIEAQTTVLSKNESFQSKLYSKQTCTFTPTESGTYYLGVHLYSNAYMGDCGFQKFELSKATVVPAQITDLAVAAGENGALSALLTWTAPSTSSYGGNLSNLTGVKVVRGTEEIANLSASPGQEMSYTDVNLSVAGTYQYSVLAYNDDGTAPGTAPKITSPWIGNDTPKAVTNLTATANDTEVSLTWNAPSEGTHNGYVNADALTYRITRDGIMIADAWAGEQPFKDIVDGLAKYTYAVYPKFDGKEGSSASVEVAAGGAYDIPYSEKFDKSSSLDFFTTFNYSGTRTWTYYSSKQCAQFWGGTTANAWLITPSIKMQAGKTYKMSFNTGLENAVSSNNYKNLKVTVGQGTTISDQSTKLWEEQIKSALMEAKECYFTVPADGIYNIGFNVNGQSSAYAIFLDNIYIEESVVTPAAVTELTVTPADNGQLKATIQWKNPVEDKAGNTLSSLTKTEVLRNGDVIATLNTPQVGAIASIQDELTEAGTYTYSVVAYAGETAGDVATVTSPWIGQDTPKAVTNVVLSDAGGYPAVTFTAPIEGVNGGYINQEALTYRIVRNPDDETVATSQTETTFVDQSELALANYSYTVYAISGELESEGATSNSMIFGGALELPYTADMTDANHMALWTFLDADANGYTWTYKNGELQYTSMKNADDYAFTPPFYTSAGKHHLQYRVKGYNYRYSDAYEVVLTSSTDPVRVSQLRDNELYQILEVVDANSLQSSMYVTKDVEFDVPVSGIYYIGFHDVSKDSWGLYVGSTSIELTEPVTGVNELSNENTCRYDSASQSLIVANGATVTVSAVNGMIVAATHDVSQPVGLSHLASGMYVATVNINGKQHVVKFVK